MRSVRLISRCRVGMKMLSLVYAKTIERAGTDVCDSRKIAALFPVERLKRPLRIPICAFFQDKIDVLRFRRPETEVRLAGVDQFRANWIATFWFHFCISRFNTLAALPAAGFRSRPVQCNTRALVKSTPCHHVLLLRESLIVTDEVIQIAP